MKYITGIHALNLPCSLETCGDWHTSAIQWKVLNIAESERSIFKNYGIETCNCVPEHDGTFYIANTLRALLDLLIQGKFGLAEGAREDFICNEDYTEEFLFKVIMLKNRNNWKDIDKFMCSEYRLDWIYFKEKHNV